MAVIGGGIAGLTAAWNLVQGGADVVLLESGPQVGGQLKTYRDGRYICEDGPSTVHVTAEFLALCDQLGITDRLLYAGENGEQRYIIRGGRPVLVPNGLGGFLATPLLSGAGKLALVRGAFKNGPKPGADDESVSSFARRVFGDEAFNFMIEPFIAGVYAGDPDRLSARYVLKAVYEAEREGGSIVGGFLDRRKATKASRAAAAARGETAPAAPRVKRVPVSFPTGLQELAEVMHQRLGARVRTRARVRALRQTAGGWSVVVDEGGQVAPLLVDQVVLAVPAHALAGIEMPPALESALAPARALPHPPVATMSFAFPRLAVTSRVSGFGCLVPRVEDRAMLGILFESLLFPGRAPADEVVITCFVGGARQPELAMLDPDILMHRLLPDVRKLLGVQGGPVWTHHICWPKAIPQFELGHGTVIAGAERAEREFPSLAIAGQYLRGVAVAESLRTGLVSARRLLAPATAG